MVLCTSLPPVHIALVGIEKILPRVEDLALFLPLLATAGTGQALTCYNTLIGGPRQPGECDGPEEFHVIQATGRVDRRIDRMTRMLDWFDRFLRGRGDAWDVQW